MISAKLTTQYKVRDKLVPAYYSFPNFDTEAVVQIDEIVGWLLEQGNCKFTLTVESENNESE